MAKGNFQHHKKRTFKSKAKTKESKNLDKRIKKIEHGRELKYVNQSTTVPPTDDPISQSGTLYYLCPSVIGDNNYQRNGTEILATSLRIRGHIHPTTPGVPTEVRIIVFWDKQANGSVPPIFMSTNFNALLDDSTSAAVNGMHCPINLNALKERYKILWDKMYVMRTYNDTNTSTDAIVIDKYIKLNRKIIYNLNSAGTSGDCLTNALWMLTIGNLTLNRPNYFFISQLRFKDP